MDPISSYYESQAFNTPYYVASYGIQQGQGLGNVLSSVFRWFKPILKSGMRSLGKEALVTGSNIINDLQSSSGEAPIEIMKKRGKEASERIQSMMSGKGLGIKRKTIARCSQNVKRLRRRPNQSPRDIFSK